MTKARRLGAAVIVLALAGLGIFAATLALPAGQSVAQAQTAPTATPAATVSPTTSPSGTTTPVTTTSSIGDTFWKGLAAKLGISVDTLKAQALQERKDMIDQAVKDGRLTQDRANQIKQQLNADNLIAPINIGPANVAPGNGQPGNGGPGFGRHGFAPRGNPGNQPPGNVGPGINRGFGRSTAVLEAVAKALNMTPVNVVNQLASGKTLADLATAQKVDQATVKQAIISTQKAEIDRQVTDGLITQAQANSLEANLTPDKIDLTRPFFFR